MVTFCEKSDNHAPLLHITCHLRHKKQASSINTITDRFNTTNPIFTLHSEAHASRITRECHCHFHTYFNK